MASQVNEVNIIRRSLYDLESQHGKVRQHYEEELRRLRAEVASLRNDGGALPGIPGFPNKDTAQHQSRIPDFLRTKEKARGPTPPPTTEGEWDARQKARDSDRLVDMRDPKRPKAENTSGACYYWPCAGYTYTRWYRYYSWTRFREASSSSHALFWGGPQYPPSLG